MDLQPPSEHQLLVFWVQMLALLVAARGLGQLARRVKLPAVVGELSAGVVLGPSLLGRVWPGGAEWLFPGGAAQSGMLFAVSWLGVLFLLVVTGLETDTGLLRSLGRAAALVAAGSIAVPFVVGLAPGLLMPDTFRGDEGGDVVFALFVAAALTTSSLAVVAKILAEMGLLRRNFGQITLAAGMANEVVGYVVLGIVAGLATAGAVSVGNVALDLFEVAVFVVLAFTLGQRGLDRIFRELRRAESGVTGWLTASIGVALALGAVTQYIGVEAVLGAFTAGVLVGRSRYENPQLREHLEGFTVAFVAPIFFATAGLRVDVGLLADATVAGWALVFIGVALAAKFAGTYGAARVAGLARREGVALGVGLNARGVLEVLIATVALSLGVFNEASYTVAVLTAIVCSMITGPLLRSVVRDWRGSHEERERLVREETMRRNVLVRPQRILLPSRGGPSSTLAASILHLAWPEESEVTILTVRADGKEVNNAGVRSVLQGRVVEEAQLAGREALAPILEEARLNYGVVGVGTVDVKPAGRLFSPLVDDLLRLTPVPLLVVRPGRAVASDLGLRGRPGGAAAGRPSDGQDRGDGDGDGDGDRSPPSVPAFRRILVPAAGTRASRAAQEVAFSLAKRVAAEVYLVHVVTTPTASSTRRSTLATVAGRVRPERAGRVHPEARHAAERVLAGAVDAAKEAGLEPITVLRTAATAADGMIRAAADLDVDVIFLGVTVRTQEGRPFVGHGVERILGGTDSSVVLVSAPKGWGE